MNILYHHRTQGKGVERVHILGIVNAWRSVGHTVDIASPPGISLNDPESQQQISASRNRWSYLSRHLPEIFFELLEIIYNIWAYFSLSRKVKEKEYNLIFERYAFLCLASLLVARRYNIPYFLEVNYTSDTPIVRRRNRLIKLLEQKIEKILLTKADGIIVVSTYLKEHIITRGVNEKKIIVLPNAADPAKFNPEVEPDRLKKKLKLEGKAVVGFIGYFYPWHGIDLLLETYSDVNMRVEDVHYLLIGDGPTHKQISEIVTQKRFNHNVQLLGKVQHDIIQDYVALFDVAVMPHSNNYGSPMKILEYMAMGKAVVAPRLGPIEDIIQDGMNGLLFAPGDSAHLSQKISELLKDHEGRSSIGKNARLSVIQHHNWQRNSEKILDLYHRLIITANH